jgi:hypothetical protein
MIRHALAAALALAAASVAADAPGPGYDAKPGAAPASTPAKGAAGGAATKQGRASSGKPRAPVRVEAALAPGAASLTLHFDAAAKEVSVKVHGTDGLEVTAGEQPVVGGTFSGGETARADVAFRAPPGEAHLVVTVSGDFRGVRQTAVASFAVGRPSAEQEKAREEGVVDDGKGGKIKLSPAQER